ncbi:MAG: transglycosylase SLT domain-containing protein [Candidatus Tectomicrobia bacterium]|uniref:Transglycosylase SLT domain-containing protein n=1 Tax=Tectimicrobiota bacterium TaxID=2528274 RepID=A0A932GRD9_UNCTE|nr:transglycosylase SLT domain-containing protein [Candidatus Tectomicrobia bacterium]
MGFLIGIASRSIRASVTTLSTLLVFSVAANPQEMPGPGGAALAQIQAQPVLEQIRKLQDQIRTLQGENQQLEKHLEALEHGTKTPPRSSILSTYRLPDKVDFAGQPVPLDKWDVKERLEREFLLMVGDAPQIILWLKRSGRHFPMIEKKLKERGLPDDLKYVTLAESGLQTGAQSWAGASGVWQFITSTGRRYKMESNNWKDERRNVEKATEGAVSYLSDLNREFRNWPLALASYNAGESRVRKAMEEQHVSNYYQLALPNETERYVFRIIAAKLILSNPARYGYALPREELYTPMEFDMVTVNVKRKLHLRVIAEAAGSYYREIRRLNPELSQDSLPPGTHKVNIPKGSTSFFAANFKAWTPDKREVTEEKIARDGNKVYYTVKKGDTLWDIASRYKVYVNSIREWNNLGNRKHLSLGQKLVIYTEN